MEERFNPFSEAIANARAGMSGVLKRTPPPPEIAEAVAEYDRRVSDPEGSLPEWKAIYDLHSVEGVLGYLRDMKRLKERWGL